MQHSISNSKQVANLNSFNYGDIYLSSLGKFSSSVTICPYFLTSCYLSELLLTFYLSFLAFLMSYFLLTQAANYVVLNLNILAYIFLLILFFVRWYTNFQKHLNSFLNFYGSFLCKILEIVQFFQYTIIYEMMENVSIVSFYRICLLAAVIFMRLLTLKILNGDENLISVFHFLYKAIVSVYYSVYLPFLLSNKILSCSLCFIKLLMLCTLRLIILFLRFLFYLTVLYLLSVFLASNINRIGSVLMLMLVIL